MDPKEIIRTVDVTPEEDEALASKLEDKYGKGKKVNAAWVKVYRKDGTIEYWQRSPGQPKDSAEAQAQGVADQYPQGAGVKIFETTDPVAAKAWAEDTAKVNINANGRAIQVDPKTGTSKTLVDTMTPEERAAAVAKDSADTTKATVGAAEAIRIRNESLWNQHDPRGSGRFETHTERADREAKEAKEATAAKNQSRQVDIQDRAQTLDEKKAAYDAAEKAWAAQVAQTKAKADAVRQHFADQIEAGKLSLDSGMAQWNKWKAENVDIPIQTAQEARAKAQMEVDRNTEERRRAEFGATDEANRAKFGYDAGQDAINTAIKLLPFQVGKGFTANAASAVNNLAQGKGFSGWSGDNFRVQPPDLNGLFKNWAAQAMALYKPTAERLSAAQASDTARSPIPMPSYPMPTPGGADMPPPPALPDIRVAPPDPSLYAPDSTPPPSW